MAEKETTMVLNVNLQCSSCYKKIKKILCKFPQIRDQLYDEKRNTVTITVVCCSPEKCRDKLCSKGGKVIESIEIKPAKIIGRPDRKVTPNPGNPDRNKEAEKDNPKEALKAKGPAPPEPVKLHVANPVNGIPQVFPAMACYGPSYYGFGGGAPWYNGYGIPPPPQPSYEGYYGYEYGYGRGNNFNRCDAYFSEENPSACSVM